MSERKGHVHAELMAQYAEDARETDKPWERWECIEAGWDPGKVINWDALDGHPLWSPVFLYRRKPKTIRVGEYDVPEPVRQPLAIGQEYWIPNISHPNACAYYRWENEGADDRWLVLGLIHLTEEAAQLHAEALLSFTKRNDADE